jgi:hypothetical protein
MYYVYMYPIYIYPYIYMLTYNIYKCTYNMYICIYIYVVMLVELNWFLGVSAGEARPGLVLPGEGLRAGGGPFRRIPKHG